MIEEKDPLWFSIVHFTNALHLVSFFRKGWHDLLCWELTYPIPAGTFESMIFLFPFGGICFLVPWRVSDSFAIAWVVPPPSNSHHQDYYIFRLGDPNLNLHLPQASWEGGQPKLWATSFWKNSRHNKISTRTWLDERFTPWLGMGKFRVFQRERSWQVVQSSFRGRFVRPGCNVVSCCKW